MKGETLYAATDYFRPFPNPEDVFANRVDEHSQYLLPIATCELGHLRPEWTGEVHFVAPIEPVGGCGVTGQRSTPYHNYLCRPNWIGYHLRGSKCELACDFRFFHKAYYVEHPPEDQFELNELPKHYAENQSGFGAHASHFQQHGWLCSNLARWKASNDDPVDWKQALIYDLGGVSFHGNWSNVEDFPLSRYPDQTEDRGRVYDCDRVVPQTEDGRDFHYIGSIQLFDYGLTGHDLLLFFDPINRQALTTIDWS